MIKDLSVKVEERMAVELAKEATLQLERSKESSLEKQILNCRLIAPGDGVVVYDNDPSRIGGLHPDRGRAPRSVNGSSSFPSSTSTARSR